MRCGGKEHVEYDNPYDVGMTGLIGFSSGYAAMHDCDALLMLGTDFPYRAVLSRPSAKIAQVDIRPENLGRRVQLDLGLVGDVERDHRRRCCRCSRRKTRPRRISTTRSRTTSKAREGARRARRGHAGQQADPPAIPRQG